MKSLRLLALALLACACTAAAAQACEAHKSTKSTTASTATKVTPAAPANAGQTATTAAVAAAPKGTKHAAHEGCSAEMVAACQSNAAVANAMGCESKGTTAAVASHTRPKSAKSDCCMMKSSSAAVAAGAKGAASTPDVKAASHDCSACLDWTTCETDVRALGAKSQVVPLKNGAMIVYTADSPADVKMLQMTVAKRHEKLLTALAAGGSQKLCPECKALRGAIASGKLNREVVNVERGCMTLLTSSDQAVVVRIRNMTGQQVAMR